MPSLVENDPVVFGEKGQKRKRFTDRQTQTKSDQKSSFSSGELKRIFKNSDMVEYIILHIDKPASGSSSIFCKQR